MVIVKLIGGLGNQLFQYAIGRKIAHIRNAELKLDISAFQTYKLHKYSLGAFNIIENFATPDDIARFKNKGAFNGLLSHFAEKWFIYFNGAVVYGRTFTFNRNIFKVPKDVYLDGYWQSEKYFKDIETILRQELRIKLPLSGENAVMSERIGSVAAVSLHIRRGDYVSDPLTYQTYGVCSFDYYRKAVEIIAQRVKNPQFFVFSNESLWAQENLILDYPTTFVANNNADKNYEDLRLISMCKHHILANSTFGWWGGWLCDNPDKIIIAPQKWFNKSKYDTRDLIPETWIRI